jgi:hypothetical protein
VAAQLFLLPFRPAIGPNSLAVPGASLFFYQTKTLAKAPVYTDSTLNTPLTNPVVANAAGVWPSIYLDTTLTYRVVLKDNNGVTLSDVDPFLPSVIDGLSADILAAVASATSAASSLNELNTDTRVLLESVSGFKIAQPISQNPNEVRVTLPSLVDQQTFEVLIAQTNTSNMYATVNGNRQGIKKPGTGANLAAGDWPVGYIANLTYSASGAGFFLNSIRQSSFVTNSQLGSITTDASGSRLAVEALVGLPAALPNAGNVNSLVANRANPADGETFEVFITATNTSQNVTLKVGNISNRVVANPGTGANPAVGDLAAGTIRKFTYSFAGSVFSMGAARVPTFNASVPVTANPQGGQDADFLNNPWGTVANSGNGSTSTPIPKNLVVIGSSNAAVGYVDTNLLPSNVAAAAISSGFPGGGIQVNPDNQATQGAPWSDASRQLGLSTPFINGTAKWVLCFFWMNDARTIFYCDYGGVQSQFGSMYGIVDYIRSKGAEPVLVTGFHPDPRASPSWNDTKALDPFYFTDNPQRTMVYPVSKAAPVSPTVDMVPAATDADFMVQRDWTGRGIIRTGYKRVWHVNRAIRLCAAQKGCAVLDLEYSSYRNCLELIGDKSADLEQYYSTGNPLHPKALLYQQAVVPVIQEWARAQANMQFPEFRIFRG